jgi:hypothetical protein
VRRTIGDIFGSPSAEAKVYVSTELRSAGEYRPFLCACLGFVGRLGRQLQDCRFLAFTQECEKEGLSVRQFERIVMHVWLLSIDLAEDRSLVRRWAGCAINTNRRAKSELRAR